MKDQNEIDELFQEAFKKAKEPYKQKYWSQFYQLNKIRLSGKIGISGFQWFIIGFAALLVGGGIYYFDTASEAPEEKALPKPFQDDVVREAAQPNEYTVSQNQISVKEEPSVEFVKDKPNTSENSKATEASETRNAKAKKLEKSTTKVSSATKAKQKIEASSSRSSNKMVDKRTFNQKPLSLREKSRLPFISSNLDRSSDLPAVKSRKIPLAENPTRRWSLYLLLGVVNSFNATENDLESGFAGVPMMGAGVEYWLKPGNRLSLSAAYTERYGFSTAFQSSVTRGFFRRYSVDYLYFLKNYQSLDIDVTYKWSMNQRLSISGSILNSFLIDFNGEAYSVFSGGEQIELDGEYDPGLKSYNAGVGIGINYLFNPQVELGLMYRHSFTPIHNNEFITQKVYINELNFKLKYYLKP